MRRQPMPFPFLLLAAHCAITGMGILWLLFVLGSQFGPIDESASPLIAFGGVSLAIGIGLFKRSRLALFAALPYYLGWTIYTAATGSLLYAAFSALALGYLVFSPGVRRLYAESELVAAI